MLRSGLQVKPIQCPCHENSNASRSVLWLGAKDGQRFTCHIVSIYIITHIFIQYIHINIHIYVIYPWDILRDTKSNKSKAWSVKWKNLRPKGLDTTTTIKNSQHDGGADDVDVTTMVPTMMMMMMMMVMIMMRGRRRRAGMRRRTKRRMMRRVKQASDVWDLHSTTEHWFIKNTKHDCCSCTSVIPVHTQALGPPRVCSIHASSHSATTLLQRSAST